MTLLLNEFCRSHVLDCKDERPRLVSLLKFSRGSAGADGCRSPPFGMTIQLEIPHVNGTFWCYYHYGSFVKRTCGFGGSYDGRPAEAHFVCKNSCSQRALHNCSDARNGCLRMILDTSTRLEKLAEIDAWVAFIDLGL